MYPSGVYPIGPPGGVITYLFCDMDTEDGPWTVIQRRINGNVDFFRNWNDYKKGFGDLYGDFWIGNDILHLLTNSLNILRVGLETWDGTRGYAQYSKFQVDDEGQNYRCNVYVPGYTGNISGESLGHSDGQPFSTFDRDNDVSPHPPHSNCAVTHQGAWWFRQCTGTNLNGRFQQDNGDSIKAMFWWHFPPGRVNAPLRKAWMMIR
ncbi:ficolin-3-like [Pecten maximus]|uniref:ficolin-3-like n=1 Tax=Pecten maximus TaxID=6579 RepID=UPI0014584794|nr:ficolin-3-like [Pecten maximus]